MRRRTGFASRFALLIAPFAVMALMRLAGAGDEALSGGFLTAGFLCYLVIPTLALERRRHART
jgi:hypothetical protein